MATGLINDPNNSLLTPMPAANNLSQTNLPASTTVAPAVPGSPPVPAIAATTGYTPSTWNVAPDQTVENRLAKIIGTDSPLSQQAETFANEQSNKRGLLNSSLAVGAAQDAVIKNAIPIAQQDATISANAGQFNASSNNQANQFSATASNSAGIANLDSQTKSLLQGIQSSTSLATTKLSTDTQLALGNLDAATKSNLATLDMQNKQLLQTNQSAANLFTQYLTNLTNISNSTTMDQGAKDQAAANQLHIIQSSLSAIGSISGLNLQQYFQS